MKQRAELVTEWCCDGLGLVTDNNCKARAVPCWYGGLATFRDEIDYNKALRERFENFCAEFRKLSIDDESEISPNLRDMFGGPLSSMDKSEVPVGSGVASGVTTQNRRPVLPVSEHQPKEMLCGYCHTFMHSTQHCAARVNGTLINGYRKVLDEMKFVSGEYPDEIRGLLENTATSAFPRAYASACVAGCTPLYVTATYLAEMTDAKMSQAQAAVDPYYWERPTDDPNSMTVTFLKRRTGGFERRLMKVQVTLNWEPADDSNAQPGQQRPDPLSKWFLISVKDLDDLQVNWLQPMLVPGYFWAPRLSNGRPALMSQEARVEIAQPRLYKQLHRKHLDEASMIRSFCPLVPRDLFNGNGTAHYFRTRTVTLASDYSAVLCRALIPEERRGARAVSLATLNRRGRAFPQFAFRQEDVRLAGGQ